MLDLRHRSASLPIRSLCELRFRFVVHIHVPPMVNRRNGFNGTTIVAASRHTSSEAGSKRRDPDAHDRSDRLVTLALPRNAFWRLENSLIGYTRGVIFSPRTQESVD